MRGDGLLALFGLRLARICGVCVCHFHRTFLLIPVQCGYTFRLEHVRQVPEGVAVIADGHISLAPTHRTICFFFVSDVGSQMSENRSVTCGEQDSKLLPSDAVQAWMRGLSPAEVQLTLDGQ